MDRSVEENREPINKLLTLSIFDKGAKKFSEGKDRLFILVLEQLGSHVQKD